MRCRFTWHALSVVALGLCALANRPAHAADIAAGRQKAELCVGCHGEAGISQTENIPSLAGQPDQFIQWQLVFFVPVRARNEQIAADRRSRSTMTTFATSAPISPRSLRPRLRSPTTIPIYRKRARRRPWDGSARRATPTALPEPRRSPASRASATEISAESAARLQSGVRSGGGMAAMADVAYPLSEEEIVALAHYLAHL